VFSVGPVQRLYLENKNTSQSVRIESLDRVCRQTDQFESEAVVRQSPLMEAWEVEEPPLL
jgi:hypothetical protein